MRRIFLFISLSLSFLSWSQKQPSAFASDLTPAGITTTVTRNSVTALGGKKIDYTAYTGYLDLKNDTGKLVAKVFFTYYKKEGENVEKRPVCFTFNGGPGSSSVWLHMGGLGR